MAANHPSAAELQAFALGTLGDDSFTAVEEHLSDCAVCQEAAAATPDDTLVTLLRTAETSLDGPVTPGTGFAETIGLSQVDSNRGGERRPAELDNHPRYRIVRALGQGGMGYVWLAEHTVMGRPVALKLVRPEFLDRPQAVERFRREVRAAAKLNHPNIVAAHDAEQAGGTHFLVMEFIDGQTLAELIDAGPIAIEDACRWAIDAANGLEHARKTGLIHRDVKPHNLIRERATGRVKVLDFGLAGVTVGESSGLTGGNVVIGTPDYIAPEQAEDARTADTRSDVYSLGCTLYHLLAGRPPFEGDTVLRKLDAHRTREPQSLTAIRQDMTPALANLVAQMLAKDPAQRPQTPGEVAAALEAILAGGGSEPPTPAPRPRGDGGRWRRFRKMALWALGIAAVVFVLWLGAAITLELTDSGTLIIETDAADVKVVVRKDGKVVDVIDPQVTKAVTLHHGTYLLEYRGPAGYRVNPRQIEIRRGDKIIALIDKIPAAKTTVTQPGNGTANPMTEKPGLIRKFGRYKGNVVQIALADGNHVVVTDQGLSLWSLTGTEPDWGTDEPAGSIPTMSADGTTLVAWGQDGHARIFDPKTGQKVREFAIPPEPVAFAVITKDGTRAFVSQRGDEKEIKPAIRAWDVVNGKELFRLDGHAADTYGLALAPDNAQIATASYDKSVRLWDARNGKPVFQFEGHEGAVSSVAYSADGKLLVTGGGQDQKIRVWNIEEGRCASLLAGHTEWITDVAFTPDATRVVSVSGYEGKGDGIRVWDWRTGEELHHFTEVRGAIGSVAITPDGKQAITGEHGGDIRVWRLPPPPVPRTETVGPVRRFGRFVGGVEIVALNKDGKVVYSKDRGLTKWDLEKDKALWVHEWVNVGLACMAASDKHVLAGMDDGSVRVLDANLEKTLGQFSQHKEPILCVGLSPNGKHAASSSGNKGPGRSVRVWEVETVKELFQLKGHDSDVWTIAFSPLGDRIATASDDGTVRIWDATTGAELTMLKGKGMQSTVAWSADGKYVAAGGQDLTVRVWEVASKKLVHVLEGHNFWVANVAFTPDGTRLLSIGANWNQDAGEGIRVWDMATGKRLYEGIPGNRAIGLAACPDGRYAVTGGMDGAIRVWRLPDAPKK